MAVRVMHAMQSSSPTTGARATGSRPRDWPASDYRPEVDGLRALAVVGVILYHYPILPLPGGFVGVDVFLVISGYLIIRQILGHLEAGRFSILDFYARRARRLLPALLVVLSVTTLLGLLVLLPRELTDYGKSLAACLAFASNILFYRRADYFSPSAQDNPLLHTWSLAVEEQFYAVAPLLLWLAWRAMPRRLVWVLAAALACSLAGWLLLQSTAPTAAFYLTHWRAWQFLLGGLIACVAPALVAGRGLRREGSALLGVAMVAGAMLVPAAVLPPSLRALLATAGAGLLIASADPATRVGRMLASRPLVTLGLCSYALYLWHWPLLVLARLFLARELQAFEAGLLLAACLLLAYATWRYVEQPCRRRSVLPGRVAVAGVSAFAGGLAVMAAALVVTGGLPQLRSAEVLAMAASEADVNPRRAACMDAPISRPSCDFGTGATRMAIWGDSHAGELAVALGEHGERHGYSVRQFTASLCPPSLAFTPRTRPGCAARNAAILRALEATDSIHTVLLVAYYATYLQHEDAQAFTAGLRRTVAALTATGKRVILLGPVPAADTSIPLGLARRLATGRDVDGFRLPREAVQQSHGPIEALLRDIAERNGAELVEVTDYLCPEESCRLHDRHKALYFDRHHVSVHGARTLMPLLAAHLPVADGPTR